MENHSLKSRYSELKINNIHYFKLDISATILKLRLLLPTVYGSKLLILIIESMIC